jgi:ketosteroid isomerase-like protein
MTLHRFRLPVLLALAATLAGLSGCHRDTSADDKAAINASVQRFGQAIENRDLDGIMAYYAPGNSLLVYDVITPRQYAGADAYRKDWQQTLAPYVGPIHFETHDWTVDTEGNLAYAYGTSSMSGADKDGKPVNVTVRVTDVYRKIDGKWLVVHEHVSVPIAPVTDKPDFDSKM